MKAYNPLYLQLKDYYQDKNGDVLEIGDCKRARRIIEGTQEGRNIIHLLKQKNYCRGKIKMAEITERVTGIQN